MSLFKCVCGSTLFEEIVLKQVEANHPAITPGMNFIGFSHTVPVLRCFRCSKYHLNNVSMFGTRYDSPDIEAHKELVKVLKDKNV